MGKKILGIIIAICLMVVCAFPAMAAPSEDPGVMASYNAFVEMKEAMDDTDLTALQAATADFEEANNALDENQYDELMSLIEDEVFGVIFDAAAILGTAEKYETYKAEPNAANAIEFVNSYKGAAEFGITMPDYISDIDTYYAEALTLVPSERVTTLIDLWQALEDEINMANESSLEEAIKAFEEYVSSIDDLEEKEWEDLAAMMGEDSVESASLRMQTTYEKAESLLTFIKAYSTFVYEDATEAAADAYVDIYEDIDGNAVLEEVIFRDYEDAGDQYLAALKLLGEEPSAPLENEWTRVPEVEDGVYGDFGWFYGKTKYGSENIEYTFYKVNVESDGESLTISPSPLEGEPETVGLYAMKATLVGTDAYTGAEYGPLVFTISPLALNDADVEIEGLVDKVYTGREITQDNLTIYVNYEEVVIGEDVLISYKDNVEVGTATLIIKAAPGSPYTESYEATFKIKSAESAKSPDTSDISMVPAMVVVMVVGLIGAVVARRRFVA